MSDDTKKTRVRWQCPRCRKDYMVPQGKAIGLVCPSCQSEISTEFPVIVSTVTSRLPRKRKPSMFPWLAGAAAIVFVVAVPVVWFAMRPEKPVEVAVPRVDPIDDPQSKIIALSRELIMKGLKVPDSAVFEDGEKLQKLGKADDLAWRVSGVVRSKNELGVMLQNGWTLEYSAIGTVELLTVGDEVVFMSDNLREALNEFERACGNSGDKLSSGVEAEVRQVRAITLTAIAKIEKRDYQARWIEDVTKTDLRIRKVGPHWSITGEIRPYSSDLWTDVEFKVSHPDYRIIAGRVGRKQYKVE